METLLQRCPAEQNRAAGMSNRGSRGGHQGPRKLVELSKLGSSRLRVGAMRKAASLERLTMRTGF